MPQFVPTYLFDGNAITCVTVLLVHVIILRMSTSHKYYCLVCDVILTLLGFVYLCDGCGLVECRFLVVTRITPVFFFALRMAFDTVHMFTRRWSHIPTVLPHHIMCAACSMWIFANGDVFWTNLILTTEASNAFSILTKMTSPKNRQFWQHCVALMIPYRFAVEFAAMGLFGENLKQFDSQSENANTCRKIIALTIACLDVYWRFLCEKTYWSTLLESARRGKSK